MILQSLPAELLHCIALYLAGHARSLLTFTCHTSSAISQCFITTRHQHQRQLRHQHSTTTIELINSSSEFDNTSTNTTVDIWRFAVEHFYSLNSVNGNNYNNNSSSSSLKSSSNSKQKLQNHNSSLLIFPYSKLFPSYLALFKYLFKQWQLNSMFKLVAFTAMGNSYGNTYNGINEGGLPWV